MIDDTNKDVYICMSHIYIYKPTFSPTFVCEISSYCYWLISFKTCHQHVLSGYPTQIWIKEGLDMRKEMTFLNSNLVLSRVNQVLRRTTSQILIYTSNPINGSLQMWACNLVVHTNQITYIRNWHSSRALNTINNYWMTLDVMT